MILDGLKGGCQLSIPSDFRWTCARVDFVVVDRKVRIRL